MDIATLLAYANTIITIGVQIYKIEQKVQPQLIATFGYWQVLYNAYINDIEITEEQVTALEAQIEALSAANATQEQAIIAGTAS